MATFLMAQFIFFRITLTNESTVTRYVNNDRNRKEKFRSSRRAMC